MASKAKHQATGDTPEPASRKLKFEKEKKEHEDESMMDEEILLRTIREIQEQASATKVQAAFLLAQHADAQRDKAKKEIIFGGWTTFTPPSHSDLELQGLLMENQTDSRERYIKETAKRAGITSNYYRDWTYSHQTRGDTLSAITIVTVTQPWQRSKLLDYVKKSDGLKEKFYLKDEEETQWEKLTKAFGNGQQNTGNTIKIQPQISLWDRTTGIPLKVAMNIAQEQQIPFKQNWRDHTLVHKDSAEYILWAHFSPEKGKVTVYLSTKNIPDPDAFQRFFLPKFDEYMNGNGKGNGKGKSMAQSAASTEKDSFHLPLTHTSHSSTARYPFMIDVRIVDDTVSHWEVWRELWQEAVADATRPYMAARPSDREL